jgi:hypothetical protein
VPGIPVAPASREKGQEASGKQQSRQSRRARCPGQLCVSMEAASDAATDATSWRRDLRDVGVNIG